MTKVDKLYLAESPNKFLIMAINWSKESINRGRFPVGALLVCTYKDQEFLYKGISGNNKNKKHAEQDAIFYTLDSIGEIPSGSILYTSMEPCIMCLTTAYWFGIKEIHFAISKNLVNPNYYESSFSINNINEKLHVPIKLIHDKEMESLALEVVNIWEGLQ